VSIGFSLGNLTFFLRTPGCPYVEDTLIFNSSKFLVLGLQALYSIYYFLSSIFISVQYSTQDWKKGTRLGCGMGGLMYDCDVGLID
jgi:hypothetical protein